MKIFFVLACILSSVAIAQTRMEDFPADATPLTSAEQHAEVVGKVYTTEKFADGSYWQLAFEANGRFTFYAYPGTWKDFGNFPVGQSQICSDGKVMQVWCNEIRVREGVLLLKSAKQGVVLMALKR